MKINIKLRSIWLSLAIAFMLLIACSENLLDQDNNNATATSSFGDEISVKAAINGAFHPITGTFFWGRILHSGAILRSDEFNTFNFGTNTALSAFRGGPGDRYATEPWQELYKSIARCNNIIINTTEEGIPDAALRNSLVGQAYFLRAFDYWYLVNLFGNVPLVTTLPDFANVSVDQAPPADIWAQIISDLEMAEAMLPSTWSGGDLGRPTSGAATALKGKSYLYMGEWNLAHTTLKTLEGDYSLLPAASFGENFGVANENNAESVFELQFLGQQTFQWGSDAPGTGTMGNFHIDYAPPAKSPDPAHILNPWLRVLYEANGDTFRRNETLAYNYAGATGYGGVPFLTDFATPDSDGNTDISIATDASVEPIFTKKYAGMDIGTRSEVDFLGTNVGNNWRIIRYADVLLMIAEALNEDGMTAQAGAYVNMVRERPGSGLATISTGLSQDDMRKAIIDERAMELAGEGHRFFDLVRWNLADDYLGTTSLHVTNGSQSYHPKSLEGPDARFKIGRDELIWIPNSEIDANPNLKQNPGY